MQSEPRVILFDIETSLKEGNFFGRGWEASILRETRYWNFLSFSWKELGRKKSHVLGLDDDPDYVPGSRDDRWLTEQMWKVADEADVLIAHNGDGFDIKMCNVRFLFHGMEPPSHYQTVDTKKIARSNFSFTSNKLDDLARFLGIGTKTPHTGLQLWHDCDAGEPRAWKLMKRYNRNDVELLEKVYLALRPWAKAHAKVVGWSSPDHCPCGGKWWSVGVSLLAGGRQRERLRCSSCRRSGLGQVVKSPVAARL